MKYEEKRIKGKTMYEGNIIGVDLLTVELPDGREATRDVVTHPGASVVIPISQDNEIYVVKQYRTPIQKLSIEIPAGKLDGGEDPLVCAKRELKEETGLEAKNIRHALSIHSTPGFSNEVLHIYIATDLTQGDSCADEDEFISSEKKPLDELVDMILQGEITDAKTIVGVLFADKFIKGEINL